MVFTENIVELIKLFLNPKVIKYNSIPLAYMDKEKIKKAIIELLKAIDEDPNRPELKKTPDRVARMYEELLSGKDQDTKNILQVTQNLEHNGVVLIKNVPFYSICEHHMLPFFGDCHIAYIPNNNKVVGISKLARVIDIVSRRLQVQERLTTEIADTIMKNLKPKGVAVAVNARHLCIEMRGIKKPGTYMVTTDVRGKFEKDTKARREFLKLIK